MIHFSHDSGPRLPRRPSGSRSSKCAELIEKHPDFYPMYTKNGKWKHEGRVLDALVRRISARHDVDFPAAAPSRIAGRRQYWLEQAIRYTKPLEPRKHDREVHDLGFHLSVHVLPLVSA